MNLAIALKNGDVEIWNLLKTNSPPRILRAFNNIITRIVSL